MALDFIAMMCSQESQLLFVFFTFSSTLILRLFPMLIIVPVIAASSGSEVISRLGTLPDALPDGHGVAKLHV